MRKLFLLCFAALALPVQEANAQCANQVLAGSSANMLTVIRNNTNPVVIDKDLNTVVYVHRNNPNQFAGNSGHLRFDVSTNGGSSFQTNQGPVNPIANPQARYPNALIYNPTGNTVPGNAYMGYMAATTNGTNWNGVVTGVQQLNGSGNTENYNQPGGSSYLIAGSLVKSSQGVYWAVDNTSNGSIAGGGIKVYRGAWNGSGDIGWTTNTILYPAFNLSYNGSPVIGDVNIAFDPSGTTGWLSMMTHITANPGTYGFYPVFYKTVNGGLSWNGPFTMNPNQYSCISSNISGGAAVCNLQSDLTVDAQGNPHLLVTVGYSTNNYGLDYSLWHHLFDITQKNGVWTAYDVANVKGGPETFVGTISSVTQFASPQVSRTADGSKVFFGWTDNSVYSTGDPNTWPDFFGRGFDVLQNKWTQIKDFTSCNFGTSGAIYFPHMATEVLQPTTGVYKLAVVYGQFTSGNPDQVANFRFLNNLTFGDTDFSVTQPTLNPMLNPASAIVLCPGNQVNLSVNPGFQNILWSNGSNQSSIIVNAPGTYYVGVRSGCVIGGDSVTVKTLTMNVTATPSTVCEGAAATLSVTGNATGYTWTPSQVTSNSHTVYPVSAATFTVRGGGYNNCSSAATVTVGVKPGPNLVALSNKTLVCPGEEIIMQAAGAVIYVWSTGSASYSSTAYPTQTTTYSVTGYNAEGCAATFTLTQNVAPCVGIAEEPAMETLSIFPNPSRGNFTIRAAGAVTVHIVNALGQQVKAVELTRENGLRADVSGLAKGIYFITLESGLRTHHKIVIN